MVAAARCSNDNLKDAEPLSVQQMSVHSIGAKSISAALALSDLSLLLIFGDQLSR
jgi:hypothetical protein